MSDTNDVVRRELFERIDENERSKLSLKIKTLMERFGFAASTRVRQQSLDSVLAELEKWGIDYDFPSETTSANDYITLSRGVRPRAARAPVTPVATPPPRPLAEARRVGLDPLTFAFTFDDERFGHSFQDLFATVWAVEPVCLVVEAPEEFFTLAAGVLGAVMRRRARMFGDAMLPSAPVVLPLEDLRRRMGRGDAVSAAEFFPTSGAVYLIRDQEDDAQIDEVAAFVREALIPHTYRVRANHADTAAAIQANRERSDDVLAWLRAFSGASTMLAPPLGSTGRREFELASLMAEAAQLRDVLFARGALQATHEAFRAGFESAEHMVLKNLVAQHLRRTFPGSAISIEQGVDLPQEDGDPSTGKARPDLRIETKLWVEVETMRGLGLPGSNPFFSLEAKLRRKVEAMRECEACWLLVPSDVAVLATPQLLALASNLGLPGLRFGYLDLETREPVFLQADSAAPQPVRARGTPWRSVSRQQTTTPITFNDVAGYTEFKRRIEEDVVHPLMEPGAYRAHGLTGANGLLLYGLPGCGKSLMGRALAGRAEMACRMVVPSDLTSKWLGEGVEKIRELFDWALRQPSCLLVIDELDGIAPQRSEGNMHTDEKRQVNELLTQLDRVAGKSVTVIATTNYLRGIDNAIRRSGRFDIKIPVFPPTSTDRAAIFRHYLSRSKGLQAEQVDFEKLAAKSRLFTPSDIRSVVEMCLRSAIRVANGRSIEVTTGDLLGFIARQTRSIHADAAHLWIEEATKDLPPSGELEHLAREVSEVFGDKQ